MKKKKQKKMMSSFQWIPFIILFIVIIMLLSFQEKSATLIVDSVGQAVGAKQQSYEGWNALRVLTPSDIEAERGYWVIVMDGTFFTKKITDLSELVAVNELVENLEPKKYTFMSATAFPGERIFYITTDEKMIKSYSLTYNELSKKEWKSFIVKENKLRVI